MENPALMASCWIADVKGKERRRNLYYNDESSRIEPLSLVGTARCAVRAAFSGATMPPAASRAGTSQRDVPTKARFMPREWLQPKARQVDPRHSGVIFFRTKFVPRAFNS